MEPILNQAAKLRYMFSGKARVPLVVRAPGGGGRGNAAQHSQSLEAWFIHIPGLKVAVPSTPADAKGLAKTVIRDDNPVIFLEHKALYFTKGTVPADEYTIPFGQARICRPSRHVTIVCIHTMVGKTLRAAEVLSREGIEAEVIDPRILVPLNIESIAGAVKRTSRLVVFHEAPECGGVAGEIAMQVMDRTFDLLDAPIVCVYGKNTLMPYSESLEHAALPQTDDVVRAVRGLLHYPNTPVVQRGPSDRGSAGTA